MGSLKCFRSEPVPARLQQFLDRQKTRMEKLICVPLNKRDVKTRIIENELGFATSIFFACRAWAVAEKAVVFWDIDNTLGFEVPNGLFYPRPGIIESLKFLAAEFSNLTHGILSYRPKSGEYSIECLFNNGGCLRELGCILACRLSARKFIIHPYQAGTGKKPRAIGFRNPKEISNSLNELRAMGISHDAILEKVGMIECLKRKGKFSRMPIHLIDDLKDIDVAMGAAGLSVAEFSPHALSELVRQEGIHRIYSPSNQTES